MSGKSHSHIGEIQDLQEAELRKADMQPLVMKIDKSPILGVKFKK